MVSGTIIGESIRFGAALDGIPLTVRQIRRGGPEQLSPQQEAAGMPSRWTLIEFQIDDHDAPALASALADVLDDSGWYVEFRSPDETFVVFAGCVFRYGRGDERRRAEAEAYAGARRAAHAARLARVTHREAQQKPGDLKRPGSASEALPRSIPLLSNRARCRGDRSARRPLCARCGGDVGSNNTP